MRSNDHRGVTALPATGSETALIATAVPLSGMATRPSRRPRRNGFTLLEMLVALTILAVAFGAILQAFGTGFRGLRATESQAVAVMHARSTLEAVAAIAPLEPGEFSGDYADGYRWIAHIRPYQEENADEAALPLLVTYEIEVTVTWDTDRRVSLKTLRLAPRR
jgi:general secretion pathway protein I